MIDRRSVLLLGGSAAATALMPRGAAAQTPAATSHGMSIFGDLKYPAGFKHFDYVNPTAPKGGRFSYSPSMWAYNQNPNTFNTLNTLIVKGDAPVGLTIIFASLMVRALDEPDAIYGLVAESVTVEDEKILYRFKLRPEARFHDGTPITSEDVKFSIDTLKKDGHPSLAQPLRDVAAVEISGPHEVAVRFTGKQPRDVPLAVAGLPILSKAFYTTHPFNESTMTPPLGSGPYKVGAMAAGRFIEYERVKDWWGNDLPAALGQNNFDIVRVEFFRDRQVALEGFKGGTYWYREEFTSRHWATAYDFPALMEKRVIRFELPDERASAAQGWWINLRRKKFQDPRVREALDLAFDFEWTNAKLMYGSYTRTHSVFEGSDMKAVGLPSAEELVLLEPYRGKIPDEAFGEPYVPPVSDGSGKDRKLLMRAQKLLQDAGLKREGGTLLDSEGKPFEIEFLDDDPIFSPHVQAYIKNLEFLGIKGSQRIVDAAQFNLRENEFDFDLMPRRFAFTSTPGEALRRYFGSEAADIKGSVNLPGVKDPAIDALIEVAVNADTREKLNIACRALDRVLRAGRYWVPHWYKGTHWIATWDVFSRPETKPRYGLPSETTWWFDTEKAARIGIKL
ncbi:ABC transporter substrate-binding protein [Terrihabitans soli]|uniref:ABC transporter substrate-binding protein n=1 Tax=Terrihabitans soli TaxID=708113 RepID=A0A6S6QYB0_9HYPH|nr:extracellular solute-binding protein [Terrihabitans soli]BCJ92021.1 ABC transporter substrate-binding protein [Terrihabitans soli]